MRCPSVCSTTSCGKLVVSWHQSLRHERKPCVTAGASWPIALSTLGSTVLPMALGLIGLPVPNTGASGARPAVSSRAMASARHLEHQPAVDGRNGKVAKHWVDVASERGHPLLAVLGVAPFARVDGEIVLSALPERHLLGVLGTGGEYGAVAGLDRVEAAGQLLVAIVPQLSRQCERDRASAAQTHLALAAMPLILEDPASATVGDLQVQVAAIGVAALTTNASDEGGRKLVPGAHVVTTLSPIPVLGDGLWGC